MDGWRASRLWTLVILTAIFLACLYWFFPPIVEIVILFGSSAYLWLASRSFFERGKNETRKQMAILDRRENYNERCRRRHFRTSQWLFVAATFIGIACFDRSLLFLDAVQLDNGLFGKGSIDRFLDKQSLDPASLNQLMGGSKENIRFDLSEQMFYLTNANTSEEQPVPNDTYNNAGLHWIGCRGSENEILVEGTSGYDRKRRFRKRLLRSTSLSPHLRLGNSVVFIQNRQGWWQPNLGYWNELVVQGHRPRSVFGVWNALNEGLTDNSLANEFTSEKGADLSKLRKRLMFEYAVMLAPKSEAKPTFESKDGQEFGETYFDGIRQELVQRLPTVWDFLRSSYTGLANITIMCIGVFAFRGIQAEHAQSVLINDVQSRISQNEKVIALAEDVSARTNIAWGFVWKTQAMFDLIPFLNANESSRQQSSISLLMVRDTLIRLKFFENELFDLNGDTRYDAIVETTMRSSRERILDFCTSAQPRNRGWPERMTEFGFLGTIIGLTLAMGSLALTQVPSEDPLYRSFAVGEMGIQLRLCFSTTFWGLVAALVIRSYLNRWQEIEEAIANRTLEQIDRFFRLNKDRIRSSK